jgi:DNA-binding Lrp family transcriptional regulator
MGLSPLDTLDRGIVYLLQENARMPITDIAQKVNVSDNTVRNRMRALESEGIITGYRADVSYNHAGVQHHYLFICNVRVSDREERSENALEIPGVVQVRTLMTGRNNVHVEAVGQDNDDITRIALALDELGLEIVQETLIRRQMRAPLKRFDIDENV